MPAILVSAVLVVATKTVFIAALEALAEVVVVVVLVQVVAVVAIVGVAIGEGVAVVGVPAIFSIGLSGAETFLVPGIDGLAEIPGAIFIGFMEVAATGITIDRSRVVVGIPIIVVLAFRAKRDLLLAFAFQVLFLKAILRHAILVLQLRILLASAVLFLILLLTVLRHTLLLLLNVLLLALL